MGACLLSETPTMHTLRDTKRLPRRLLKQILKKKVVTIPKRERHKSSIRGSTFGLSYQYSCEVLSYKGVS